MQTLLEHTRRRRETRLSKQPIQTRQNQQQVKPMTNSSGNYKAKVEIDCEILRQLVFYDTETGALIWKHGAKKRVRGDKAGSTSGKDGRTRVCFSGRKYQVHRLVWLYVNGEWPSKFIDHIDGDPSNNRIENLREATQSQNCANSRKSSRNTSGYKGVCWSGRIGRWRSYVTVRGKTHWLGYFNTKEEAFAARVSAADRLHGEFARHQ